MMIQEPQVSRSGYTRGTCWSGGALVRTARALEAELAQLRQRTAALTRKPSEAVSS